jgi:hypothetical protein
MDVSHCEVFESVVSASSNQATLTAGAGFALNNNAFASGDGAASVIMYYGDQERQSHTLKLTMDEYKRLGEFFQKYPDGKIFEGLSPPTFRALIPARSKYALRRFLYLCLVWTC